MLEDVVDAFDATSELSEIPTVAYLNGVPCAPSAMLLLSDKGKSLEYLQCLLSSNHFVRRKYEFYCEILTGKNWGTRRRFLTAIPIARSTRRRFTFKA